MLSTLDINITVQSADVALEICSATLYPAAVRKPFNITVPEVWTREYSFSNDLTNNKSYPASFYWFSVDWQIDK